MSIRVYEATERLFNHNGLKVLNPLFAEITKVDNGDYYIELEDILDNFDYYQKGMIVRVKTPKTWGTQEFQCFRCDNPTIQNNRISCKAWHVFYDSKNYIVNDTVATEKNCNDALNHYNDNTDTPSPFNVKSDIAQTKTTGAVKQSLFEVFTNLVNEYIADDGKTRHWVRDNFSFGIMSSIGQDRGVVLAYNKNITDIKVEENWDNVCTKLLPYTTVEKEKDEETGSKEEEIALDYLSTEDVIYDIPYTKAVKFEHDFKKEDDESQEDYVARVKDWLYSEAVKYLEANKYPQVKYSVSAKIDNISDVGDEIWIKHPKIRKDVEYIETEVISLKYDVIRERYTSIEFGNFKKEIKNLTKEIASAVETNVNKKNANNTALLKTELEQATANINSVMSASNVIYNGNEILVVDKLPKEEAVYCIKINRAGIGFSTTGMSGTFNSVWAIDGTLNMQAINVINLTASLIKGGTLKLGGVNNASGTFELYDSSNKLIALMDKTGLTVYATNGDYVKINAEDGFVGYNKNGSKIYWADGDVFRMKNAEVENEIKIAGKIKIVPVSTGTTVGVGFVALV